MVSYKATGLKSRAIRGSVLKGFSFESFKLQCSSLERMEEGLMKADRFGIVIVTIVLVSGLVSANSARAVIVNETLASSNSSVDMYDVICPSNATYARANITETLVASDANQVKLELEYPGYCGNTPHAVRTAPSSGGPSGYATVNCAAGLYFVTVYHNATGTENYRTNIECGGSAPSNALAPPTPDQ